MKKSRLIFILCIITITLVLASCNKKEQGVVSKDTIEDIVKNVYTPESMEKFNKCKKDCVDKGIMTQEEADRMFVSDGKKELTEEDLKRTLSLKEVLYSNKSDNSVKSDLYRITASLTYNGNITNFEIVFELNTEGKIYQHNTTIL